MRAFILFFAIVAFVVTYVFSQELNNHIIQFASTDARTAYVNQLLTQSPDVEITYVDNVFVGLITRHSSVQSLNSENDKLNRMYIAGTNSILGFEKDQTYTVSAPITQYNAPWHLDRIDQESLPLDTKFVFDDNSDPINIYVADTGVRVSHQEFEGRAAGAFSAISGLSPGQDCHGHGTHVAALAAGRTYGPAKNAKIWDIRVLNCQGSGSTSGIIQGMDWVARNAQKPAVINMSLGGSFSSSLNNAVTSLSNSGVIVVVAAGNENTDACTKSPASSADAFTVGATDRNDNRSSFSNYGRCVNIYSPGTSILSAGISSDSSTTTMSGTSMASPIAAGVVASVLQRNPHLTVQQLKDRVLAEATTTSNSNINPFVKFNADDSTPAPEPEPEPQPEPEPEPEPQPEPEPEVPLENGKGRIIAFIEGAPIRKLESGSLELDASYSHITTAYAKEVCGSNYGMKFQWSCADNIGKSDKSSFCSNVNLGTSSILKISEEDVQKLKGTAIFTVDVIVGNYVSTASVVVLSE